VLTLSDDLMTACMTCCRLSRLSQLRITSSTIYKTHTHQTECSGHILEESTRQQLQAERSSHASKHRWKSLHQFTTSGVGVSSMLRLSCPAHHAVPLLCVQESLPQPRQLLTHGHAVSSTPRGVLLRSRTPLPWLTSACTCTSPS
jgi:hypothetical protein